MNIEEFRKYCLDKRGVKEEFPFDETTLVFKVMGKMFALTDLEGDFSANLKCDPEEAIDLREKYTAVRPGYHMNKRHWNTISDDGSVSNEQIFKWVDNSYILVVDKLSRIKKAELANLP